MKIKKLVLALLPIIIVIALLYLLVINNLREEKLPLADWTLEQKVGQLFIVSFDGYEPNYYISKMIDERNLGGIILMGNNIENKKQIKNLTAVLQAQAKQTKKKIPLFIATDQEGGEVARIKNIESTAQKDITSPEQAKQIAKKRSKQLLDLGINMNFSPVLEYASDPNAFIYSRTFEKDLDQTTQLGLAMSKGYDQEKMIYVPKHFPGHDNSKIDSHKDQPMILDSKKKILDNTKPFQQVIKKANPKVIMTSHTLYPDIDPENPATLSKKIITDILKDEIGYQDLVITDDLSMKGLNKTGTVPESAVKALQAGCDLLLLVASPDEQAEVYEEVLKAVQDGRLDEKEIDEKVLKILNLKQMRLGLKK